MDRPKRRYKFTPAGLKAKQEATIHANKRRAKPVVCITTGEVFGSIALAAESARVHHSAIAHAIRRGGTCRGRVYVLASSIRGTNGKAALK